MLLAAAGCSAVPGASPVAPSAQDGGTTSVMSALSGTWRTTTAATGTDGTRGPCSGITYTLTPTGPSSASATYGATCGGVAISGSGTATAAGSGVAWTTSGGLGACPFTLSGTLTPTGASSAALTYAGTVCGLPVSGSESLTR